jgi:hypothetical protein
VERTHTPISRQAVARLAQGVLLLLVVRVVAAPVALNPSGVNDPLRAGLILRVCTWPEQSIRPTSQKLTTGERTPVPVPSPALAAGPARPLICLLRVRPLADLDRYTQRALDRMLC